MEIKYRWVIFRSTYILLCYYSIGVFGYIISCAVKNDNCDSGKSRKVLIKPYEYLPRSRELKK